MSVRAFDIERHRRERLARLTGELEHLRVHRATLERILARCLLVAAAGTDTTPLALLAVLEDIDRIERGRDVQTYVAHFEDEECAA